MRKGWGNGLAAGIMFGLTWVLMNIFVFHNNKTLSLLTGLITGLIFAGITTLISSRKRK